MAKCALRITVPVECDHTAMLTAVDNFRSQLARNVVKWFGKLDVGSRQELAHRYKVPNVMAFTCPQITCNTADVVLEPPNTLWLVMSVSTTQEIPAVAAFFTELESIYLSHLDEEGAAQECDCFIKMVLPEHDQWSDVPWLSKLCGPGPPFIGPGCQEWP